MVEVKKEESLTRPVSIEHIYSSSVQWLGAIRDHLLNRSVVLFWLVLFVPNGGGAGKECRVSEGAQSVLGLVMSRA